MNSKIKILIVDSDKDTIESTIKFLGDELYTFEIVDSFKDSIRKILNIEFDIVIINNHLWTFKENALTLLKIIERENAQKLKKPYIILISSMDSIAELQSVLSVTPFKFVVNDTINYLYDLEWSIINLVPVIFYKHKKKLIELTDRIKNLEINFDNSNKALPLINSQKLKIEKLEESHSKFQKDYVSWRSITESLGILVGGFSIAMGIIVAFIVFLAQVQEKFSIGGIEIPFVTGFFIFMIAWSVILFFLFNRFANKNNK